MKIYYKLKIKLNKVDNEILFGFPNTEEEMRNMFKLRYDLYSKKGYIDSGRFIGNLEKDNHDNSSDCTYFISKIGDEVIGTVRLIKNKTFPTRIYFDFKEPKEIAILNKDKLIELGRLISKPYKTKEGIYLPRGIVMLFLISSIIKFSKKEKYLGGYSFIKSKLKDKMIKRGMPFKSINDYKENYPKGDILYKYFTQKDDPVSPIYFLREDFEKYISKVLSRKCIFEKIDENTFRYKDNFFTKLINLVG